MIRYPRKHSNAIEREMWEMFRAKNGNLPSIDDVGIYWDLSMIDPQAGPESLYGFDWVRRSVDEWHGRHRF
jgi:hypothetical protein